MSNYYEILGVDRNASPDEIKKSYRKLAKEHHPDHTNGDKELEEKFKKISEAYNTLSNQEKRQQYDNPAPDFLKDFFGGMGGFGGNPFRQRRPDLNREELPKRGVDVRQEISASIADFIFGGKVEININCVNWCEECNGNGGKNILVCKDCNGIGMKTILTRQGNHTISSGVPCPTCRGRGFSYANTCEKCKGNGKIQSTQKVMIDIPAGIRDGMGIRLAGAAGKGTNGAPNGDVLVKVNMRYPIASKLTEEQVSILRDI